MGEAEHDLGSKGYTIVRGLVPTSLTDACRARVLERACQQGVDGWPGVNSKRVKDPLEWGGAAFTELINLTVENMGDVVEAVLGPAAWLTSFHALVLFPTSIHEISEADELRLRQGSLHNDYPYGEFKECMDRRLIGGMEGTADGRPVGHGEAGWQFPSAHRPGHGAPHTLQTIWVLDPFTQERGATMVLPQSHKTGMIPNCGPGEDWNLFCDGALPMLGDAGDLIMYIGATWHTIGINRGSTPRVALLGQWAPHYMTPLEPHVWMTPSWVIRRLSDRSKGMLGLPPHTASCGGCSSRPPHRAEHPRPLVSCAWFAYDTLVNPPPSLPLGRAIVASAILTAAVVSATSRGAVLIAPQHSRPLGWLCGWIAASSAGLLLGVAATLRRFNF
jgi:hypothetical protein